jgi:hypothetical protein
MISLVGIAFRARRCDGDFAWMLHQPRHANSLFVFNDNVQDHATAIRGRGSAIVRPFNAIGRGGDRPRSVGIATGFSVQSGGFKALTPTVRELLDEHLDELRAVLARHTYDTVYFAADADGHFTCRLFAVHPEVLAYIERGVRAAVLEASARRGGNPSAPEEDVCLAATGTPTV